MLMWILLLCDAMVWQLDLVHNSLRTARTYLSLGTSTSAFSPLGISGGTFFLAVRHACQFHIMSPRIDFRRRTERTEVRCAVGSVERMNERSREERVETH